MTAETATPQEFTFQAEIKQLLHLLSHSLYQNKEVAIRELVSNASDALDKFRHLTLTDSSLAGEDALEIHIEPSEDDRLLVIRDNGIGMTHDELVQNLGTIAHSGSLEFLSKLPKDGSGDVSLIGQFGVGFYSSFMLADTVEVRTRSYGDESGWTWKSDGTGSFSIEQTDGLDRGTQIRLHLKEDLDEFTREERLKYILTQYSTFVPHPIKLDGEHVNDQKPIWVEPKSSLSDEQYEKFYQYLSHRSTESPMWHFHLSADSPIQFNTILYCPPTNIEAMGFGRAEHGLHLCAKRILVQNDNRDLLPEYLRFIYGLVDSDDLPLNVSRESLMDNSVFRKISKILSKRVLGHLQKIADDTPEEYDTFYQQFGSVLREGISTDFENREQIGKLLRFQSSNDTNKTTSLDAYIERADDEQNQIYYIGGPDLRTIEKNPNLEIFRKKKLEVLYLTDPVDEFVLSNLFTYEGKSLTSIDSADIEFPGEKSEADKEDTDSETDDKESTDEPTSPGFDKVLRLFKEALGDRVEEVKQSKRLTDSPCCLVNPEGAASSQLQKVLSMANQDFEMAKRIFEINPDSPFIERLVTLSANDDHEPFIKQAGLQLFSNAMLLEGLTPDVDDMVDRMQTFMDELASNRSPLVT
ncbi:MAG: molecular chaperone HtpG [Planctomycetaceae bacterium]|nr:molecular chaperone HtpG [Planctomycetaceae bacterium]